MLALSYVCQHVARDSYKVESQLGLSHETTLRSQVESTRGNVDGRQAGKHLPSGDHGTPVVQHWPYEAPVTGVSSQTLPFMESVLGKFRPIRRASWGRALLHLALQVLRQSRPGRVVNSAAP